MRGRQKLLLVVPLAMWAALAIAANANNTHANARSLGALVAASQHVVIGTVVKVDTKGETSLVTIEVEHVGKGDVSGRVSFRVPEKGAPFASHRVVAFLASQARDGTWRLAGDAGDLLSERRHERGLFVVMRPAKDVPSELCDAEVTIDTYCALPTAKFLELAKLKPWTRPPPSGTFRVRSKSCAPCELDTWLHSLVPAGVKHCGGAPDPADDVQCVLSAQKKNEPFWFSAVLQGVESPISRAVVSVDGGSFELWYDPSIEGWGDCAAAVTKTPCRSLTVNPKAGDDDWLRCEKREEDRKYLCDQTKNRVDSLSEPKPLAELRCASESGWNMRACVVGESAGADAGYSIKPTGSVDVSCIESGKLWCSE